MNYEIFYRTYTVVHPAGTLLAACTPGSFHLVDPAAFPASGICYRWYIQAGNSYSDVPFQSSRHDSQKVNHPGAIP